MELESCIVAPSDWPRATIESLCAKFTSGGTPSRRRPEFYKEGVVPWVKTKELHDAVLQDTEEWITEEAIANSSAKRLPANTVLLAMYGATVGQLGILGREMACNQACAAMVADDDKCDYRFLFYQLLANRRQIVSLATGAAQQNLSGVQIKSWTIALPGREEQRSIADTLGALDDRINNLRQTNTTLQAIASALFKSWFVDFEGVPPEDMQVSELGLIPKGWRVGTFHEVIEILGGGTPKTSVAEYWNGDIPWFSVVDAPASGQVFVLETEKQITKVGLSKSSAKLLPEMTTIISARGTVGKVALTGVPMAINQSCYALRPRQQNGEAFVYFFTLGFVEHLQRIAHGAVFDTITRDSFQQVTAFLPTDEVVSKFGDVANPLLQRIRANGKQAATLAALRDTLLPRLISGRLRISETTRQIAEVTG